MAKKKNVKRTLAASLISMALCGAMLVGSTYAWFTDEAKSGTNQIVAGNLDIELERTEFGDTIPEEDNQWESVKPTDTDLFSGLTDETLWEPGVMFHSDPIRLKNVGNLALQYSLKVTGNSVTYTTSDGETETIDLSDVIKMKVIDAEKYASDIADLRRSEDPAATQAQRKALWDKITDANETSIGTFSESGVILPSTAQSGDNEEANIVIGQTKPVIILLYWEPNDNEIDNKYNLSADVEAQLKIDGFGISVFATQTPYESDSFGDQYDANAMAQHAVLEAVTEGIEGAQDAINAVIGTELQDAITVSELTFNEETNAYETTFKFTDKLTDNEAAGTAVLAAFSAMQSKIAKALFDVKSNVTSVTINDVAVDLDAQDADTLGSNLLTTLMNAYNMADLLGKTEFTIPVVVVDAGGTSVAYNLNFDLEAIADLLS